MSKRFFCNENILNIFLAFVLSRSPLSLWLLGLAPHMGQVVHSQGTPYVRVHVSDRQKDGAAVALSSEGEPCR